MVDKSNDAPAADAAAQAPASPEAKGKKAGKKGETIFVIGPDTGRWRAGRKFTSEAAEIDLSTITAEQLAAIEGDPELRVSRG